MAPRAGGHPVPVPTTSRPRRTAATVLAASALVLFAGACGDDEDGAPAAPVPSAPGDAVPGAPAPGSQDGDDDERPDGYDEAPAQPRDDDQDDQPG